MPDEDVIGAMRSAAARGVTINLVVPAVVDQRIVHLARRSYYRPHDEPAAVAGGRADVRLSVCLSEGLVSRRSAGYRRPKPGRPWSDEVKLTERFEKASDAVSGVAGKPAVFFLCCLLIVAWGTSGPLLRFSDTWQLIINTSTTIITFLMVFVIQSSQTRNDKAVHAKLDELVRAVADARPEYTGLENRPEHEIDGEKDKAEQESKAGG